MVFVAKERHKGKDPLDPSGRTGSLLSAAVALRVWLVITPAILVQLIRFLPHVRPLARRFTAQAAARAKRSHSANGVAQKARRPLKRPFLSYTGRGAVFLFGAAKRKTGGRMEHLNLYTDGNKTLDYSSSPRASRPTTLATFLALMFFTREVKTAKLRQVRIAA